MLYSPSHTVHDAMMMMMSKWPGRMDLERYLYTLHSTQHLTNKKQQRDEKKNGNNCKNSTKKN
jgi:hypothetical protein